MTETLRFDGSLWMNLDVALRNLDHLYERVTGSMDLSVVEFYIMQALYERDGQHASELARAVGRAPTSFTPLLDKLEEKDLITRRPDPTDRRAILIYLTEAGKALRRRVLESAEDIERSMRRLASDGEWNSFRNILARLVQMEGASTAADG